MTRSILSRILTVAFLLVGGSGIAVQVTGADIGSVSGVSDELLDPFQTEDIASISIDGPSLTSSCEHHLVAPELFFESEEEIREEHLPNKVIAKESSNSTYIRSLVSEPSVFSLNDLSSIVGCGRNFHAAPPLRIVLGVFRV